MKTVILTGSQGFLGSYISKELLEKGYRVVGFDNFSKYGIVQRPHDLHPNFKLCNFDLTQKKPNFADVHPDYVILGAAMIGGISYFHKYAFDLIRTNERILANCYDAIFESRRLNFESEPTERGGGWIENNYPERVVTISSSMVFEGADKYYEDHKGTVDNTCCCCGEFKSEWVWPTREDQVKDFPPPLSTYGAQKLMCEYWARGAWEQYKLPYTIVRPFNAVGAYENEALGEEKIMSGNVALQMSHVLPDLINKCLKGQDPLHILGDGKQVRCYTNGADIARGIVAAMESPAAHNEDFNISIAKPTSVLELAELVWNKINPGKPFRYVSDEPFEYDVQKRIPNVSKAKNLLGFEAQISLEDSVTEVIDWMKKND